MRITEVDIWTVVVPVHPEAVHSEQYGGYPDWAKVPKQIILVGTKGFRELITLGGLEVPLHS